MNQPLVTVMIPTRKRVPKLMRTIDNLLQGPREVPFEIRVMIDDDDAATLMMSDVLKEKGVIIMTSPPLGYTKGVVQNEYYVLMEDAGSGEFVWFASDDMEVRGNWQAELAKVPRHGFIVQPEISMLHESVYAKYEKGFFPIVPRFCWKEYADYMPIPFDYGAPALLIDKHGWKTWFLKGVTMVHDRPDELDLIMADPTRGNPEMLVRLLKEKEQKEKEIKTAREKDPEEHFKSYAELHRKTVEARRRPRR